MSRGGRDETKCWGKQAPWCCAYHGSCDFGRCRRRLRGHLCGLLQGIWHCSCLSDSTKRLGVSLKEKEKRSRIAQRGKSNQMFEKVNLFLIFQFYIVFLNNKKSKHHLELSPWLLISNSRVQKSAQGIFIITSFINNAMHNAAKTVQDDNKESVFMI